MIAHCANKSAPDRRRFGKWKKTIWSQARISLSPLWRVERCDYDVLAEGFVVGRIMKVTTSPAGTPWMWTLAYGYHEDRTPTHGYEPTREAAMAAFAKSWRREWPRPALGVAVQRAAGALWAIERAGGAEGTRRRAC
jgi:hypothetical protein